ncbi:Sec20-domain-containing protein [Dipodascopsis tothii]|uniref:Sec20-domain-containing protein n=1 Tax=Dipodascopsis tothii TaxID=44089 RepID=UPI0034CD7C36
MSLSENLSRLDEVHRQTAYFISRLVKYASARDVGVEESVRQEMANLIRTHLREADMLCELVALQVDEERADAALAAQVHELTQDVKMDHTTFRKAQLVSKKNVVRARQRERALLYTRTARPTGSTRTPTDPRKSHEDRVLATAEDATFTLRRSHQLLDAEVAKSELSISLLDDTTTTLRTLTQEYGVFDTTVLASRKIIDVLSRADKQDRIMMIASLSFLVTVVAWILWKRVFRGPVGLIVWGLVKSWRVFAWGWGVGVGKDKGGAAVVASVAAEASARAAEATALAASAALESARALSAAAAATVAAAQASLVDLADTDPDAASLSAAAATARLAEDLLAAEIVHGEL